MSTAKRYQPQGLLGEQGGVQTFAGRDAMNGLPVRVYSFMGTPTGREGELRSDFVPPVLSATRQGGAGEVVTAFSETFQKLKGTVAPAQVERLLLETATALDDAARAGVVHGDLSPERVFYDREAGGRFVLDGYGVPWRVRPSEFSAPERIGGPSFAGDVFAWARTVKHLSGPLPGGLRDLLDRCLSADPAERPNAREVRAALERYPFSGTDRAGRTEQSLRDTSAFEGFSEGDEDEDTDHDPLKGLTLLPKVEPETVRQSGGARAEENGPDGPLGQPTVLESETAPTSQPGVYPRRDRQPPLEPLPRPVRVLPAAGGPGDTGRGDGVQRFDATPAYRARLEAYNAKLEAKPEAEHETKQSRTVSAGVAEPAAPEARPVPSPGQTRTPEPRVLKAGARDPNPTANPTADPSTDPDTDSDTDPAFDPGFDDVNDRAPDPTLYRGGRRVLLLTLLGIALLVLVALQLLNA